AAYMGGAGALAVASGMAAIFSSVASITSAGQNIVSGSNIYGGTMTLFEHTLKRFGIEVRFVDSSNPQHFADAMDENTRLFFTEAIGNPRCNVDDLEAIQAIARKSCVPLVLDATTCPPPIGDPLALCDIALFSLTKIIGGHGTAIGGAIVDKGTYDWNCGDYPEITGPDPTYHGLNLWETMGGLANGPVPYLALKARIGILRDTGAAISPMNAHAILQGLETLDLRGPRHCENAMKVAEFLESHPAVAWHNYAGRPCHPDHVRAMKYFPLGPSAVFGFGVKGGSEAGRRFIESVKLCSHLANILDARTLVIHPATTTHSQCSAEELANSGVSDDLIRISVGLEHPDDIIADLDQALRKSQQ
ncbi:MAG: PLP-dependent transferase, partial [Proteobacteria bacterium]|nr:PLP-dependent transferase [Pseudomonadota bacterium]